MRAGAMLLVVAACGCHGILMPVPEIDGVEPRLACLEADTTIEVTGRGFSPAVMDLVGESSVELPHILLRRTHLADGSADVGFPVFEIAGEDRVRWMGSRRMQFDVEGVPAGLYSVIVENPDGSGAMMEGAIFLSGRPAIESFSPGSACRYSADELVVTVEGGPFLLSEEHGAEFRTENSEYSYPYETAGECEAMRLQDGAIRACRRLVFRVPITYFFGGPPGGHRVVVEGLPGCEAVSAEEFVMVPCPEIGSVSPAIACAVEEDRSFTLGVSDLVVDPESDPVISVGGESVAVDALGGCREDPLGLRCETIDFTIPRRDTGELVHTEVVLGGLASDECCHDVQAPLVLAPPPLVRTTSFEVSADIVPAVLLIRGDFVQHGSSLPIVTLAGRTLIPDDAMYCAYIAGLPGVAMLCGQIMVTIPVDLLVPGATMQFTVTNPDPVGCTSTEESFVHVREAP